VIIKPIQIVFICVALLLAKQVAASDDFVLDGLDGDVTTNEYRAFLIKLQELPPPPSNNIGNLMVDERDGARLHGMQTFYAFTHERRDLDMAIVWSDAFLHARNDPANGRILWTGQRDLCWPNKATNEDQALHAGAENGDVIEHIVNTARLILENPSIWSEQAPTDTFGFGATYLDRAKTYVRECQRSAETTIVPWFVRSTGDGYRLYHPDSPAYLKCCDDSGPVPWNQQQELVGALLRLAQCHRLLNDDNTNIAYYEKITTDAAAWFFDSALAVNAHDRVCYQWTYVAPRDPATWPEVTSEADYDMFIFRTYQANLGPTRQQMQRLINTARFVMYLGTNRFAGKVDGTSNAERHDRKFLQFQWIEMSVLDKGLYQISGNAVLASHEYWDNLAVEAAVLSAKHYWATAPASALEEVVDDPKGVPPLKPSSSHSNWTIRAAEILGWSLCFSELGLSLFKRSKSNATSKDRNSLGLIWVVNLGAIALAIFAAHRFYECRIPYRDLTLKVAIGLFSVGLTLRWWAIIHLGRFFTTNVAIANDQHVVNTGPYRFMRHPSYTGSLMALTGFALSFHNWASFLCICIPCFAVTLWRIHIEEQALAEGLGQPYKDYMARTKRLIPFVY